MEMLELSPWNLCMWLWFAGRFDWLLARSGCVFVYICQFLLLFSKRLALNIEYSICARKNSSKYYQRLEIWKSTIKFMKPNNLPTTSTDVRCKGGNGWHYNKHHNWLTTRQQWIQICVQIYGLPKCSRARSLTHSVTLANTHTYNHPPTYTIEHEHNQQ